MTVNSPANTAGISKRLRFSKMNPRGATLARGDAEQQFSGDERTPCGGPALAQCRGREPRHLPIMLHSTRIGATCYHPVTSASGTGCTATSFQWIMQLAVGVIPVEPFEACPWQKS